MAPALTFSFFRIYLVITSVLQPSVLRRHFLWYLLFESNNYVVRFIDFLEINTSH